MVADRGWLAAERFIGTTGRIVAPKLYIAFGVSGATQHVAGIGGSENNHRGQHRPHVAPVEIGGSGSRWRLASNRADPDQQVATSRREKHLQTRHQPSVPNSDYRHRADSGSVCLARK